MVQKIKRVIEQFSFPACLLLSDQMFRVKYANSSFIRLYRQKTAPGKSENLLDPFQIPLFSGREEIIGSILKEILRDGKSTSFILHPHSASQSNGQQFTNDSWLVEVTILKDPDEKPDLLLLTLHEVSAATDFKKKTPNPDKKKLKNRSLEKTTRQLRVKVDDQKAKYNAAAKELDNFVYSVSHDLRAPLRRVDGYSQELVEEYSDRLDEVGMHYLERIRQGTQDMGQLIDDLLKLSRIARKKIVREDVEIDQLVQEELNKLTELEPQRKVECKFTDSKITSFADKGLVRIVLMNLLSNALKFSSQKERTIITVGTKKMGKKQYILFSDNGVGFDPAHSDKLFRAFSRLHSQREYPGTGIGLATVKRIIRLHGGEIFAESKPGEGATFYFKF